MQIALSDWHNKTRNLQAALIAAGHTIVDRTVASDVLLMDVDFPIGNYRAIIAYQQRHGAKVFLYSHGADAFLGWDGIWEPQPLDGYLAMAEGTKEIMSRFSKPYPNPVHVIGWHYCEMLPFQPVQNIKRVLFAPHHPHSSGYLHPVFKEMNRRVLSELAEGRDKYHLTVRHLRAAEENGLDWYEGVEYIQAQPDNKPTHIDEADLVVSIGTFAQLAIARGKPTIMYGQDVCPHEAYNPEHCIEVASWNNYRDYMRYPFEWDEVTDLETVCTTPVDAWRKTFLGEPFQPRQFTDLLERLVLGVKEYA